MKAEVEQYKAELVKGFDADIEKNKCNINVDSPFVGLFDDRTYHLKLMDNKELLAFISFQIVIDKFGIKVAKADMSAQIISNAVDQESIKESLYRILKDKVVGLGIMFFYCSHWSKEENKSLLKRIGYTTKQLATFILDLKQEEDDIFMGFDSKRRNTVRKAEKHDIEVIFFTKENCTSVEVDHFHQLMAETQQRAIGNDKNASMQLKSKEYLAKMVEHGGIIVLAYVESEVASGAFISTTGNTIYYYLGGSRIHLNRKLAVSDLLHWRIIKYAKTNGFEVYDFGGVPPNPTKDNPAYGVYSFKKKFGGVYHEYFAFSYYKNRLSKILVKNVLENKKLLRFANKLYGK